MIQLNQTEVSLAEGHKNLFKQTIMNVIHYCRKNNDTGFYGEILRGEPDKDNRRS